MTLCTLSLSSFVSGCSSISPSANIAPQVQSRTSTSPSPTIISKNSTPADRAIPRYKHIFTIVAENKGYQQIGNVLNLWKEVS